MCRLRVPISPMVRRGDACRCLRRDSPSCRPAAAREESAAVSLQRSVSSAAAAAAAAVASSSSSSPSPPLLLLRLEKKNYNNTWRCPGQSADSPAGYWLAGAVCHRGPSRAEQRHHLLRACCDENKDRGGRSEEGGSRRGQGFERCGGEGGEGRGEVGVEVMGRRAHGISAELRGGIKPCLDRR